MRALWIDDLHQQYVSHLQEGGGSRVDEVVSVGSD